MSGNKENESFSSDSFSLVSSNLKPNMDSYVTCPYDRHHVLLPTRLTIHLIKCGRNHPGNRYVRCPFNNTHLLQSADLSEHISICENHKDFVHFQTRQTLPSHSSMTGAIDEVKCDESWDDEPWHETYDPKKHHKENFLLRNCIGAQPAERRAFRESQREKFKELNQDPEFQN